MKREEEKFRGMVALFLGVIGFVACPLLAEAAAIYSRPDYEQLSIGQAIVHFYISLVAVASLVAGFFGVFVGIAMLIPNSATKD